MQGETIKEFPDIKDSNGMHMQAGIIDQLNTNQQSNMTLSAYSVITQNCSTIKFNIDGEGV